MQQTTSSSNDPTAAHSGLRMSEEVVTIEAGPVAAEDEAANSDNRAAHV